jgi:hypothetical protein
VLLPLPGNAIEAGANVPVTFFGSRLTESATADANPLLPAIETVNGIDPPRGTIILVPPSARVKVGATTVSPTA